MKIKFLIPPSIEKDRKAPERIFGCNFGLFSQQNIFMLYPAAVLEKAGHIVDFDDCVVEKKNKLDLSKGFADVYCFYTVYLAEKTDKYWANEILKIQPNAKIVFMGPEPTAFPEKFLSTKNEADAVGKIFVIRGETEETILELINEFGKADKDYKKIKGLSFSFDWANGLVLKHNPPRHLIKDLDKIPFPARHLIKHPMKYFNPKLKIRPTTTMLTSRNCFGRCTYCIPCSYMFAREIEHKNYHKWQKPIVGLRSPHNIYEEFRLIKDQGYKSVCIMDDNFVNGKERTIEICKLIEPLKIKWGCLARADTLLDDEMLEWMHKAGCQYVDLGIESFEQKVLDDVHKDMKVSQYYAAIFMLKFHKIEPKVNILFGVSPLQTEESIKKTLEILKKLSIDYISFGITIPHPYTEFYKTVKENKWFATQSGDFEPVDPYKQGTVNFPNLDHKKLMELVSWAYKDYYLRPSYIWNSLIKTESLGEFWEKVKITLRLFR